MTVLGGHFDINKLSNSRTILSDYEMMSVSEVIKNPQLNKKIYLKGIIVIIDSKLWLIDSSSADSFPESDKVAIGNNGLKKKLLSSVALYGGGVTVLFHDAEVSGYLSFDQLSNTMIIEIDSLYINNGRSWQYIDMSMPVEELENEDKESDWFDLFK